LNAAQGQPTGADSNRSMAAPGAAPRLDRGGARLLVGLIGAMLLVRLATLGSYALMDTSEARYGEIARVMLATGNWVTPQEIPGTPFWAKPPLSTWLSAASAGVFGVNEFALRLPSFLCALGVLGLCFAWSAALPRRGPAVEPGASLRAPLLTLALLSTSVLFFVSAGAVMTDPSLALCTTAMLAAFHRTAIGGSRAPAWRYGFFLAAGLGMLAKGPVILLYAGAPIGLWALWQRRIAQSWAALPWLGGTLLAAAVCVPWYVLAEQRTPGFQRYFLLGEHVMRFLRPGWGGDLYGTAHAEPLGTIWLYLAGSLGLNTLLACAAAFLAARRRDEAAAEPEGDRRFLLLAGLVPMVFFTFAGNIIWTYVLPALSPLAVLIADALAPRMAGARSWRAAVHAVLVAGGLLVALSVVFWVPRQVAAHSSATLAARWREQDRTAPGPIYYVGRKAPASLRFYTRGQAKAVADIAQALDGAGTPPDRYLALAPDAIARAEQAAAAHEPPLSVELLGRNTDLALLWVHAVAAR
jgi:4-amino-4-deoxy-L-arabinose transferase-like glycosyltransferase